MKALMVSAVLVLASASSSTFADCTGGSQVKNGALATLLTGKTVCATLGADKWQEEHVAGGALYDYKKGPTDPVDPRSLVGSWATSGTGANSIVTYTYTGGGNYSFTVFDNGNNTYDFCAAGGGATTVPNATLKTIGGGC